MKKRRIILTLVLALYAANAAWAQSDDQQTAPSPAPAFGQGNPVPSVDENTPISAIDQPPLEPHAAPESFLLAGLHFSESVDSNVENTLGGSSISPVTRGLGSLTLQKLWKDYDLAINYIGGAVDYANGSGLQQLQQLGLDNRITWKRGQLAVRDSFSYLPEGNFGFGAYGGSGAYNSSLGSLGAGMLGAGAFAGQTNAFVGGSEIAVGQVPLLANLGLVDVVENLTPKSSVTLAVGYGLAHFYGDLSSLSGSQENIAFIGSREFTVQAGYDRTLDAKNQVALIYGYQAFDFSTVSAAFHSNVVQAMYGHRISGRMDFTIGAGPQFTHVDQNPLVCSFLGLPLNVTAGECGTFGGTFIVVPQKSNGVNVAGRVSLRYRFPKTSFALSFQRYDTTGSGIFAGALSNIANLDVQRPLTRVWDLFSDLGYSRNSALQLGGSTVDANSFTAGYAGVGVHRQFGRNLRAFVSYQFNILNFDTACPVPGTSVTAGTCSSRSNQQVGSIGLDWTPRPMRLE